MSGQRVVAVFTALTLGACAVNQEAGTEGERTGGAKPARPPGETQRERCEAFHQQGLAVDATTRPAFHEELGAPVEVRREPVANRHVPGAMDTISVLRYEGLDARIHTAMGRDLLERVTVRDDRYLRYDEPGIGAPRARLVALLGEPGQVDGDTLEFQCGPEPFPHIPVTFSLVRGRVESVRFDYYVD